MQWWEVEAAVDLLYTRTSVLSEFNCSLLDRIQLAVGDDTDALKELRRECVDLDRSTRAVPAVSSAYICGEKPLSSINDIRSAVYKMNNRGPNTHP